MLPAKLDKELILTFSLIEVEAELSNSEAAQQIDGVDSGVAHFLHQDLALYLVKRFILFASTTQAVEVG